MWSPRHAKSAAVKGHCGVEDLELWGLGHVDHGVQGTSPLVYYNRFRHIVLDKWCDLRENYKCIRYCKGKRSILDHLRCVLR